MAKKTPNDTLFEERQELMISPTGGTPTLRTAHFLKPTVKSIIDVPIFKLPSLAMPSGSACPLKVYFKGWREPPRKWRKWVEKLHRTYHYTWKKAGIYEAIMASTCNIRRNYELVLGLAERWNSETNSFVFPWGEATVTLEDMMVLGGFSVLGINVLTALETQEMADVEKKLEKARMLLQRSSAAKATHWAWLNYFNKESGHGELEHEAFLSLWLSRFVIPENRFNCIIKNVFSVAIYLARGTRIALAPTVLANLYRDLGLLGETLLDSSKFKADGEYCVALTLWSPLQYVQVWAWERLPPLQPKPNFINLGEPRLARWDRVKRLRVENLRWVLDSCGESFMWRPYVIAFDNWLPPKFYKDKEQWMLFNGEAFDEELESFARCLRVSLLVGVDSVEPYLPHRVAMQFGMDQDLPKWFRRSKRTAETAWKIHTRPFIDAKMYVPSRLFESDVTKRYMEWWRKSVLDPPQFAVEGVIRRKRSSRKLDKFSQRSKETRPGSGTNFSPGFHPKSNWGKGILKAFNKPSSVDNEHSLAMETRSYHSASSGDNKALQRMGDELTKQKEMNRLQGEVVVLNSKTSSEEERCSLANEPSDFEIERRVRKLEKLVAGLKAARLGCR